MIDLTIRIPPYVESLDERITNLQRALITVEKPYTRAKMNEVERRQAVKALTEKFRTALIMKASLQKGHLPGHSQSASSSDLGKTQQLPTHRYCRAVAAPLE
jgi:hypothetical protein